MFCPRGSLEEIKLKHITPRCFYAKELKVRCLKSRILFFVFVVVERLVGFMLKF